MTIAPSAEELEQREQATVDAVRLARKLLRDDVPELIVEQLVAHVLTSRRARARIDLEGEVVVDGKNSPIAHPALAIEREAHRQIRDIAKGWAPGTGSRPALPALPGSLAFPPR